MGRGIDLALSSSSLLSIWRVVNWKVEGEREKLILWKQISLIFSIAISLLPTVQINKLHHKMTCSLADHAYIHTYIHIFLSHMMSISKSVHTCSMYSLILQVNSFTLALSLCHTHTRTMLQIGCVNYNCCLLLVNLV